MEPTSELIYVVTVAKKPRTGAPIQVGAEWTRTLPGEGRCLVATKDSAAAWSLARLCQADADKIGASIVFDVDQIVYYQTYYWASMSLTDDLVSAIGRRALDLAAPTQIEKGPTNR